MDATDRKILAELQREGRLSITDLADRVGLSVSPCHRRLRELERSGTITGYRATVDPAAVGYGFEAIVFVTMASAERSVLEAFEHAVADETHITQAERLFGDPDYLLRIATEDLPAFQRLYDDSLGRLPGVRGLRSTLVMKRVADRAVAL